MFIITNSSSLKTPSKSFGVNHNYDQEENQA